MSDAMGRRPDGPGWYWYEGDGEGVELADPVYCAVTLAITLKPGTPWYRPWTIPIEEMPGDFVPLTKPVAAPTWSQEPPTEEGWYWFVGKLVQPYDYNPQIYTIRTITPMYLFWTIVPVECLIIDHADFIWRAEHAQGYWLPATVPQPPSIGEVTE